MIFQARQTSDKSIITLLAPLEVFVVSSRLVTPEISDLSCQFAEPVNEIRQSQSDEGDNSNERGDDGWVGHASTTVMVLHP
jgi:hypothetical protein